MGEIWPKECGHGSDRRDHLGVVASCRVELGGAADRREGGVARVADLVAREVAPAHVAVHEQRVAAHRVPEIPARASKARDSSQRTRSEFQRGPFGTGHSLPVEGDVLGAVNEDAPRLPGQQISVKMTRNASQKEANFTCRIDQSPGPCPKFRLK